MKKILLIGQAPPAQKQEVPYDSTLLYEMLSWIGIDKNLAQRTFEFEAMTDKFPGYDDKGRHMSPNQEVMENYYKNVLSGKINEHGKVILLGNLSRDFFRKKRISILHPNAKFISVIHPSKRNYASIMNSKHLIIQQLKHFIFET